MRRRFQLGDRIVDPLAGTIETPGTGTTRIEPRTMQVLLRLVRDQGALTSREILFEDVWDGRHVSEDVLSGAISILRKALGDSPRSPRFIQTVTGEGYRIVAPVTEIEPASAARRRGRPVLAAALGSTALLAVALLAGGAMCRGRLGPSSGAGGTSPPRIAVLPFENLSDERGLDHLAAGITDGVITQLARQGSLRVISRTSILRFAGTRLPLQRIAEELGSDLVVEGSVLPEGDGVRVSAQLIDSRTDTHLWADEFVRPAGGVFALISDLSATIGLRVSGAAAPDPLPLPVLHDPGLRAAYWEARHLLDRPRPETVDRAESLLDQVVEAEPSFAPAHLELARLAYARAQQGFAAAEHLEAMRSAASKAAGLAPRLPGCTVLLATYAYAAERDFAAAEDLARRALAENPSDSRAHALLSQLYLLTGRPAAAIRELEIVDLLDPDPASYAERSFLLYRAGRRREAFERLERLLAKPAVPPRTRTLAARMFEAEGDDDRAVAELKAAYETLGGQDGPPWGEGLESVQRWRIEAWERHRRGGGRISLTQLAVLYASVGDRERAASLMEEAHERRELPALSMGVRHRETGSTRRDS